MEVKSVLDRLSKVQEIEREAREGVRESFRFRTEKDGQWEPEALRVFSGRPKYQFDLIYPVIQSKASQVQERDFGARVIEVSRGAGKDLADTYDGVLRSIQNLSSFSEILHQAGKRVIADGYDAWMIKTDWADVDAFDQDLLIKPIKNAVDRVYLGRSHEIDHLDRKEGWVLSRIDLDEYKKQYKDKGCFSIGDNQDFRETKGDLITIADYYYIKHEEKLLHLLSDNQVLSDEDYQKVANIYSEQGITSVRTRKRKIPTCYMRKCNAKEWLTEEQKTVFSFIPIIEVYGNYEDVDGDKKYHGETWKLMDQQRVYNYAVSREIADGALAPVEKIAMTTDQARGYEDQNSRLNHSTDPILEYNPDPKSPTPPYKIPGPTPNAQLAQTQMTAAQGIERTSSVFAAAKGEGMTNHSGKAYEMLSERSDMGIVEYMNALKLGVYQTMKIIIDAIPKVYDRADRQVRVMSEDGQEHFVQINTTAPDGSVIRDLSQGHYDISTVVGASYKSREEEAFRSFLELGKVDPSVLEMGKDLFIRSSGAPWADQLADRIRPRLIQQGVIQPDEFTEEERERIAQDKANQQPDPMQIAMLKAMQMEMQKSQAQIMEMQSKAEERQGKLQIAMMEQMRRMEEFVLNKARTEAEIQKTQAQTIEHLSEANDGDLESQSVSSAADKVANSIN